MDLCPRLFQSRPLGGLLVSWGLHDHGHASRGHENNVHFLAAPGPDVPNEGSAGLAAGREGTAAPGVSLPSPCVFTSGLCAQTSPVG